MARSPEPSGLRQHVREALENGLDRAIGIHWQDPFTLRLCGELATALAERICAKGLGCCVDCGFLTRDCWQDVPMCRECQEGNAAIQQMRGAPSAGAGAFRAEAGPCCPGCGLPSILGCDCAKDVAS